MDPQTKIQSAPAGAEDRGQQASVGRSAIETGEGRQATTGCRCAVPTATRPRSAAPSAKASPPPPARHGTRPYRPARRRPPPPDRRPRTAPGHRDPRSATPHHQTSHRLRARHHEVSRSAAPHPDLTSIGASIRLCTAVHGRSEDGLGPEVRAGSLGGCGRRGRGRPSHRRPGWVRSSWSGRRRGGRRRRPRGLSCRCAPRARCCRGGT
jgi:hypothetical protein